MYTTLKTKGHLVVAKGDFINKPEVYAQHHVPIGQTTAAGQYACYCGTMN
jgi:hypothetical protein